MVRGRRREHGAARHRQHGHGDDGVRPEFRQRRGRRFGESPTRRQRGDGRGGICITQADHTDPAED